MKTITWNMRRASAGHASWQVVRELDPDIAFLQEVVDVPQDITSCYSVAKAHAVKQSGEPQKFLNDILSRIPLTHPPLIKSKLEWVNSERVFFSGNMLFRSAQIARSNVVFVCVYSPAWPVAEQRLKGIDVSGV
jgi:hypothetical protein